MTLRDERVGAFDKLSPNGKWFVFAEGFDTSARTGMWGRVCGAACVGSGV